MQDFTKGLCTLVLGALVLPLSAAAAPPPILPVQGYLTDESDVPLDGVYKLGFSLFDASEEGNALFATEQPVTVEAGSFTVYLGDQTDLDLRDLHDNDIVWLEIIVVQECGDDITCNTGTLVNRTLSPRLQVGTTAFAASATYCGDADTVGGQASSAFAEASRGVPSGSVMFFDLPACPTGWTELTAARGRALVGLPQSGTLGHTVGSPLTDGEDRQHTHDVNPASVDTSSTGSHTHAVDPASRNTSSNGGHGHMWANLSTSGNVWHMWNQAGENTWSVNIDANGIAFDAVTGADEWYPLGLDEGDSSQTAGREFYTSQEGAHTHSVNIPSTTSTSSGSHAHSVDVPSTQSTAASTSNTIPYLQLRVCRKD